MKELQQPSRCGTVVSMDRLKRSQLFIAGTRPRVRAEFFIVHICCCRLQTL
jgi:hypothetical protein